MSEATPDPQRIPDPSPTTVVITSDPDAHDYLLVWHGSEELELVACLEPGQSTTLPFSADLAVSTTEREVSFDVRYFR